MGELTSERLVALERLVTESRKRWPHSPGMSTELVLALTPEVVFALIAAARERDELAAFKAEWSEMDGNSPGYNRQKARNYGQQAFEWKQRAEAAEKSLDELREDLKLAAGASDGLLGMANARVRTLEARIRELEAAGTREGELQAKVDALEEAAEEARIAAIERSEYDRD